MVCLAYQIILTCFDVIINKMNPFFIVDDWLAPFRGGHHMQNLQGRSHTYGGRSNESKSAKVCRGTSQVWRLRI